MSRKRAILLGISILSLVVLLATLAETGIRAAPDSPADGYIIDWWTVDGGGGTSQSSAYTLMGIAGQPDPGVSYGGAYNLKGGFWGSVVKHSIYIPLLRR
jgi:hypothetical protein